MTLDPSLPKPQSLEQERNMLAQERTLLASERTFLAWLRTGLTSIGIGIAIARLLLFQNLEKAHLAQLVGQLLIVWGLVIFGFALVSYRRTCKKLSSSLNTPHSFTSLTLLTLCLALLSLTLFWIVV
jgi:putative membrane protein